MKKLIFIFLLTLPCSLSAGLMLTFDEPYKGLSDNTVIDIITHKNAIWMATGRGLAFSHFGDTAWFTYDKRNGLVSDEVSAIYSDSIHGRLWVATNHTVDANGISVAYADGLSFTYDEGRTWDTLMIPGSYGYQSSIYDITGYDSLIFCASWVGGLFGSFNAGENWRHIFFSPYDSTLADSGKGYLSLRSRYFSTVLDTTHRDSLVLWAGSADGLMRYIFAPAYSKPSSNHFLDIASGGGYVFLGGDSGLTRLKFENKTMVFHSAFRSDGLPGKSIASVFYFGGRTFAGTSDTIGDGVVPLAVSDDDGLTFRSDFTGLGGFAGPDKYPLDFATVGHTLFMAGVRGGLYSSNDTGHVWQKIQLDTINPPVFRTTYSLASDSNQLWAGSDSQLVLFYIDNLGGINSSTEFPFADTDTTGALCYRVRVQEFRDTAGVLDSTAVWTLNHPIEISKGKNSIHRYSTTTHTWDIFPSDTTPYYDIGFIDSLVYLVGKNVFAFSPYGQGFSVLPAAIIQDSLYTSISLGGQGLNSIEIVNDTIYVGSSKGLAISPKGSNNFHIIMANTNPQRQDTVTRYISPQLSGNFIPTLGIQYLPDGRNLIWANARPNDTGQYIGISASTLDGQNWDLKHEGSICWNFAFYDSAVFAATSDGLLYSPDLGESWDTLSISGTIVNYWPPQPYHMGVGTEAYAARIINDTLWVGTSDGAAKINVHDLRDSTWDIYRAFDTSQIAYAYPEPYSPYPVSESNQISFHYPMNKNANVTIEVYDFAMNLVKRVTNSEYRAGGPGVIYHSMDKWDGHNGKGEIVAAGIYYFKIEQSSGDVFWGKLAVIP